MARFVTPAGVVVETSAEAARAVGYKPADEPAPERPKKTTRRKKAAASDEAEK